MLSRTSLSSSAGSSSAASSSGAASLVGLREMVADAGLSEMVADDWFDAVTSKDLSLVRDFIASGINFRMIEPDTKRNALHYAMQNLNVEMVHLLLNEGFDLTTTFSLSPSPAAIFHHGHDLQEDRSNIQDLLDEEIPEEPIGPSHIPASAVQDIEPTPFDPSSVSASAAVADFSVHSLDADEPIAAVPLNDEDPSNVAEELPSSSSSLEPRQGYLEFLLIVLGEHVLDDLNHQKKFNDKNIPAFERILDMMLCNGLKIDQPWSPYFQKATEELISAANYKDSITNRRHQSANLLPNIRQLMPANTILEKIKKALAKPAFGLLSIYVRHKINASLFPLLEKYINAIYLMKPKLYSSIDELAQKKREITHTYKAKTNINAFFPVGVDDIILDYTNNINSELIKSRIEDKCSVKFWPK